MSAQSEAMPADQNRFHVSAAGLERLIDLTTDGILIFSQAGQIIYCNQAACQILGCNAQELIGMPISRVLSDDILSSHFSNLIDADQDGILPDTQRYTLSGRRKNGDKYSAEIAIHQLVDQDESRFAVIMKDTTRRTQVADELRQQLERTRAVSEMSRLLAEVVQDYDQVLRTIACMTSEMMGDTCVVSLATEDREWLEMVAYHNPDPAVVETIRSLFTSEPYHVGDGLAGEVYLTGQARRLNKMSQENQKQVTKREYHDYLERIGMSGLLLAPIVANNNVIGTLGISRTVSDQPYTQADEDFLVDLAARAGLAIVNARLLKQTQEQLQEIQQIDNELQNAEDRFYKAFYSSPVAISISSLEDGRFLDVNDSFLRMFGYTRLEVVGKRALDLDMWVDPEVRKELVRAIQTHGAVHNLESRYRTHSGDIRYSLSSIEHIELDGKSCLLTMAHDITERVEALRTLEQQVEEGARTSAQLSRQAEISRRDLEALYRADEQLYRHLHLEQVLQALVDVVIDLLHADKASVQVWDPQTRRLVVKAARGFSQQAIDLMSKFQAGEGIAGQVFERGELITVDDARLAPHPSDGIAAMEGISSVVCVPIRIQNQIFGVFGMDYCSQRIFSEEDKRLLLALAHRAAIAIENARLYGQAEQAATLEERQRLARELHDSVTQSLYSLALLAEAGRRMAGDRYQVEQVLSRLGETAQQALREMRLMVYEMRPLALQEVGLAAAIQQRLDAVEKRAGIQARMMAEGQRELSPDQEVQLYQIAQEALNNALAHASASQVEVQLNLSELEILMLVKDNGIGFEVATGARHSGMGLTNMRERAERMGASLTIDSILGKGTSVKVEVPVSSA